MLFRRKKKEETPKPPQPLASRAMSVVIILILAAAVAQQWHKGRIAPAAPVAVAEGPTDPITLHYLEAAQQNALGILGRLHVRSADWINVQAGTGIPAFCGQEVSVALSAREGGSDEPVKGLAGILPKERRWRLGTPKDPFEAALQPLVIGQGTGGIRETNLPFSTLQALLVPPTNIAKSPERLVRLRATVQKVEAIDKTEQPLIVFETTHGDPDRRAGCGESVTLAVRLWDGQGHELHPMDQNAAVSDAALLPAETAHRVIGRIGDNSLPYGVARAIEGMGIGATRVALVPPALQTPRGAAVETDETNRFHFPESESTPIVQITLLDAGHPLDTSPESPPAETPTP